MNEPFGNGKSPSVRVTIAPDATLGALHQVVTAAGATVVTIDRAEVLIWFASSTEGLSECLAAGPNVKWVSIPNAGVEEFAPFLGGGRIWTGGKAIYAEPVAEHALGLILAGMRAIGLFARCTEWTERRGRSLYDTAVTLVGGGGVARALLDLLRPFRVDVTVVRRSGAPIPGATRVLAPLYLKDALAKADVVVLAAAMTAETRGMIGIDELRSMRRDAWLVNVGRGGLVVTDDLVAALEAGLIAGAALDVTDPEPLPNSHPLWRLSNCIVTPHSANTAEMMQPLFERQLQDNLERYAKGRPLRGVISVELGY